MTFLCALSANTWRNLACLLITRQRKFIPNSCATSIREWNISPGCSATRSACYFFPLQKADTHTRPQCHAMRLSVIGKLSVSGTIKGRAGKFPEGCAGGCGGGMREPERREKAKLANSLSKSSALLRACPPTQPPPSGSCAAVVDCNTCRLSIESSAERASATLQKVMG